MQHFSADSLILRAVDRGENDKLLTVLTAERGRFYAILKGAHSMRRRETAATEPFTWSNVEYYEKNGVKWVKTANALDSFPGIRYDMDKLFLAAYVADVAFDLSDERQPAGEILPLVLNTLYMLSVTKGENERIKAAFEMRAASIAGFRPELGVCRRCGKGVTGDCYFDVMNGAPICLACHGEDALRPLTPVDEFGERTVIVPMPAGALAAVQYVSHAEDKRVFAFRVADERAMDAFARASEEYLLHHLERGFPTLENYKKLKAMKPSVPKKQE